MARKATNKKKTKKKRKGYTALGAAAGLLAGAQYPHIQAAIDVKRNPKLNITNYGPRGWKVAKRGLVLTGAGAVAGGIIGSRIKRKSKKKKKR